MKTLKSFLYLFKNRLSRNEKKYLLKNMKDNAYTEKELITLACDTVTVLFLINKGYFNIIPYITNNTFLLIQINNKTILELFFEDTIKDKKTLNIIKETINTILKKFGSAFSLPLLFDTLDYTNVITKEDLLNNLIDSKSIYKTKGIESELIYRKHEYYKKNYNDYGLITSYLLEKEKDSDYTNLDYLIMYNNDKNVDAFELENNLDIAKVYLKNECFEKLFKYCNKSILCTIDDDNKSIIDYYIDYLKEKLYLLNETSIIRLTINQELLLLKGDNEEDIYLDILIKELKDKNMLNQIYKIDFDTDILMYSSKYLDGYNIIDYCIKENLLENLLKTEGLKEDFWLYNIDENTTILEYLLGIDKNLTLDIVNSNKLHLSNPNIIHILNNENDENITLIPKVWKQDFKTIVDSFSRDYFKKYYRGDITEEKSKKIEYLRKLLLDDGISNKEAINLACDAFKTLYINNYLYADRDLDNTIYLVENESLFLIYDPSIEQSYYSIITKCIYINNKYDIGTFNHELAHAHHYEFGIDQFVIPKGILFYLLTSFLLLNDKKLDRIKEFKKNNQAASNKTIEDVIKPFFEIFDKERLFMEYYNHLKRNLMDSKDDSILNEIVDKEVYMKGLFEAVSNVIPTIELSSNSTIEDILDAVYKGYLFSNGLKIDEEQMFFSGHGEDYYNIQSDRKFSLEKCFTEIFANYVKLLKAPNSDENMKTLRELLGNNFVNILDNFYKNMNLGKEYTNKKGKVKRLIITSNR